MTSSADPFALDPHPDEVAALVAKVVSAPWPNDRQQSAAYLTGLGCTAHAALPRREDDLPEEERGLLQMPGSETGTWAAVDGLLDGLNFFFYPGQHGAQALTGFDAVSRRLHAAYGPPADEGGYPSGHRYAVWLVGETSIQLYAHVEQAPMLQLGLEHRTHTSSRGGPKASVRSDMIFQDRGRGAP